MISFRFLATFLLLPFTVLAAPSHHVDLHRREASINETTWNNLNMFEQYCAATYCAVNFEGDVDMKLRCHIAYDNSTTCPVVEAADTNIVAKFNNIGPTGLTGYAAYDHTNRLIVFAFRGTQTVRNYITDFVYWLVDTDLCEGCQAHAGWWDSWQTSRDTIIPAVEHAVKQRPTYKLVITGHSLGAAQATLCAGDLRKRGFNLSLYAYGSPRLCNPTLAKFISAQPGGTYRVTHLNDPVAQLPMNWTGYDHIRPEYYIDSATNASATIANVVELQGESNPLGNAGQAFVLNFAPHEWYFNNTTACAARNFALRKRE